MAALRAAIPSADLRLLDAAPSPHIRNGPVTIAVRLLISTNGLEAGYEAVLAELLRTSVLSVDGQSVRIAMVPTSVDDKARLWLALGMPFVPSIVVEAGPIEI